MAYDYFQIPGTKIILHTDPELETGRLNLMRGLLTGFGRLFKHRAYAGEYRTQDPAGRCYDQAMQHANEADRIYVEGFMIFQLPSGGFLPMGHGWCVTKGGIVEDPTCWKHTGNPIVEYLGVPIRKEYSEKWKELTGYYGCMDGYFDGETVHTDVGIYADHPSEWLVRMPMKVIPS